MKCSLCSTPMPDDAAFCPECGNKNDVASPPPVEHLGGKTIVQTPTKQISTKLEPGAQFAGRYTIERTIGAGGMGTVYLAKDADNSDTVALKLINQTMLADEAAAERLIAEGLLTRKIRHPNVIAVHDVAKAGQQPYVTMEYLDGMSLRAWIGKQLSAGTEIAVEVATGIVNALLDGLQAAHNEDVIHRDLKPENVMLLGDPNEGDFRLKILDFGIAKAVSASLLASSTSAAGTPLYMAPEQRTSPDAVRASADIYSLSRMLYELLMDVLPDGMWQAPSEHRNDVPAGIDAVIQKGLSNRPRSRQQSVEEFRSELAAVFADAKPKAEVPPEPQQNDPEVNNRDDPNRRPPPDTPTGAWTGNKMALIGGIGLGALIIVMVINGDFDTSEPDWQPPSQIYDNPDPTLEETRLTARERLLERMASKEEERTIRDTFFGEDVGSIAGNWWYNDTWPTPTPVLTMNLDQDGAVVSGTARVRGRGSFDVDGTFVGKTLTLNFSDGSSLSGPRDDDSHFNLVGSPPGGRYGTYRIHKDQH